MQMEIDDTIPYMVISFKSYDIFKFTLYLKMIDGRGPIFSMIGFQVSFSSYSRYTGINRGTRYH